MNGIGWSPLLPMPLARDMEPLSEFLERYCQWKFPILGVEGTWSRLRARAFKISSTSPVPRWSQKEVVKPHTVGLFPLIVN
jgi:hypothetical protein